MKLKIHDIFHLSSLEKDIIKKKQDIKQEQKFKLINDKKYKI